MARSNDMFAVHDVHCLTRGDVAGIPRACSRTTADSNRPVVDVRVRGTIVTTGRLEAFACAHETRFADQGRQRGQTVGSLC